MFDAIIIDGKKESYLKLDNNKITGFTLINNVISNITPEDIEILNYLKLSNNKTYIGKQNEYDVFLDNESNLTHFFKDNKEDLKKFYDYNGKDFILYKQDNSNNKQKNVIVIEIKSKKSKAIVNILIGLNLLTSITCSIISYNNNTNANLNIDNNSNVIVIEHSEPITYEQIDYYLNDSNYITTEDKELFNNEKLLNDVIPYYNGTNMDYLITKKMEDLKIVYYYEPLSEDYHTTGYYNTMEPNVININVNASEAKQQKTKGHEYIHLLQSVHIPLNYLYLSEASAELINYEYYGYEIDYYKNETKNLKILLEIVGPEPIWELNFAGDDTKLKNIIENNLEEKDSKRLLYLLNQKPKSLDNIDLEIENLLNKLYKNIYKEDIVNNTCIIAIKEDRLKYKYYFNSEKIEEHTPYYAIPINEETDYVFKVLDLPNIYETFPDQKIDNLQKNKY